MRRLLGNLALLKRLHWASWSAMSVTLLALVVILVPGDSYRAASVFPATDREILYAQFRQDAEAKVYHPTKQTHPWPLGFSSFNTAIFEHGWPRPFLARALVYTKDRQRSEPWLGKKSSFAGWGGSAYHNVSWSNWDNWPFSADHWIFHPWSFLLDLLAAVAIIALVGGLVQWRVRRNGGLLRFHLADMLALITLIGLGLGSYLYHDTLRRKESFTGRPVTAPAFASADGWIVHGQSYHGPTWLRKLVGSPHYLPVFHHVDTVTLQIDAGWKEIFARLPQLPYFQALYLRQALPIEAIDTLKRCPRLEELHLGMYAFDTPLYVPGTQDRALQPEDFSKLGVLPLKKVYVGGVWVQKQHLVQLAEIPTMRNIQIQSTAVTDEQVEELRQAYPHVRFYVMPDVPIIPSPG